MGTKKPGKRKSHRQSSRQHERRKTFEEKNVAIPNCDDAKRRKRLEADDPKWLRYYFGETSDFRNPFWYEFTAQQREMITAIGTAIRYGGDQAIFGSRGEGKTTISERLLLKYVLEGTLPFAVLFGATGDHARNSLKEICESVEQNDLLCADYPEVCAPVRALQGAPQRAGTMTATGRRHDDRRRKFDHEPIRFAWSGTEVIFPRVPGSPSAGAVFATRGLESTIRGLKKIGRRPRVVVIDDPDTDDTIHSDEQAGKVADRIDNAIGGLGDQQHPVARVILCTMSKTGIGVSHIYGDRERKPSFVAKRFSYLVKPPDQLDSWMDYIARRHKDMVEGDKYARGAHQFYLDNQKIMDAGAVVANPHRFDRRILPDGSQIEVSSLQGYYNAWADKGEDYCLCELDNNPREDDTVQQIKLTAYQIQHSRSSGLEWRRVPEGIVAITIGMDIRKLGFHYVAIAWNEIPVGFVVEYAFHELAATQGKAARNVEHDILEGLLDWHSQQADNPYLDADGNKYFADLTLIDAGWKEESWMAQPVELFCSQVGFTQFLPSKGSRPYRYPKASKTCITGDNWNITYPSGTPLCLMNHDHWKLKVHEGFLAEHNAPGSLLLPASSERQPHFAYARHITHSIWEERYEPGFARPKIGWFRREGRGNTDHYWDATYQALVGRSVLGIDAKSIAAKLLPQGRPARRRAGTEPTSSQDRSTPGRRRINLRRRS